MIAVAGRELVTPAIEAHAMLATAAGRFEPFVEWVEREIASTKRDRLARIGSHVAALQFGTAAASRSLDVTIHSPAQTVDQSLNIAASKAIVPNLAHVAYAIAIVSPSHNSLGGSATKTPFFQGQIAVGHDSPCA